MLEDFDDTDELDMQDITSQPNTAGIAGERAVRRRSSKACDNCRKSKCKCERNAPTEPCKNCVLNGLECTFLGPTRKRGPPKGYIDALESKLHQMEALFGAIISSHDFRARSLVFDLSQNDLARQVIQRIDDSPFGTKGRNAARDPSQAGHSRRRDGVRVSSSAINGTGTANPSEYSPYDWQEELKDLLHSKPSERVQGPVLFPGSDASANDLSLSHVASPSMNLVDDVKPATPSYVFDVMNPHQRRRLDSRAVPTGFRMADTSDFFPGQHNQRRTVGGLTPSKSSGSVTDGLSPPHRAQEGGSQIRQSLQPADEDSDADSDLADAVGQLSVNDLQQVRYHGKASGLHLLMPAMEEMDSEKPMRDEADGSHAPENPVGEQRVGRTRVKKGIWDFPPAGVWPPVLPSSSSSTDSGLYRADVNHVDAAAARHLPIQEQQEEFISLYFSYVHPILPIVHKGQFLRDFKVRSNPQHPEFKEAVGRVSNLLLLAMFAITARYSDDDALPDGETMWTAGDVYAGCVMDIMPTARDSSSLDIVQALLLSGYRDIGLGCMARAWLHIGMAIRVGQDLGLHRSIAKWQAAGQIKFTAVEKQVRARTWYACVRMDKYVSTYIGRPVMVYERDYDTLLPEIDEEEENELWIPFPSPPHLDAEPNDSWAPNNAYSPQPSRLGSCLRASVAVAKFTASIIDQLYVIRAQPLSTQREICDGIEQNMEKWYFDLPDNLRYVSHGRVPCPHVLVLHMQYWCAYLLLHRPFLQPQERRPRSPTSNASVSSEDRMTKAFNRCQIAAHHITNIATTYMESFCPRRFPAVLTYYVFSAAIMHVTSLMENPNDGQARIGLQKANLFLKSISVVWPSAARARDLLAGVKANVRQNDLTTFSAVERKKRMRESEPFSPLSTDAPPSRPASPQSMARSPSTHRRSVSHLDFHRPRSQSLRVEPPQMFHTQYPTARVSMNPSPLGSGAGGSAIDALGMESSAQLVQRTQPSRLHSTQAPQPVHSRWMMSEAGPYNMGEVLSQQQQQASQFSEGIVGMHTHSNVGPQYTSYAPQYAGHEIQRQSPVDSCLSSAATRPSAPPLGTSSAYQELYQPTHPSDAEQYGASSSSSRGLWTTYSPSGPFANPSLLAPYGTVSIPGSSPLPSGRTDQGVVPPMLQPNGEYGQAMQQASQRPPPEGESSSGFSALDAYFSNTSGTSSAYLGGNFHRHPGH